MSLSFLPSESLRWSEIILRCLLSTLKIQFDEDILITGQQSLMMLLERIESLFRDNEREIIEFYKISLGKIFDKDYIIMTENVTFRRSHPEGCLRAIRWLSAGCLRAV